MSQATVTQILSSADQYQSSKSDIVKAFVAFIVAEIIFNLPAVITFSEKNLELTAMDVKMIPVGGLLFFIFWKAMEAKVFIPYLKLFEAREAATVGSVGIANEIESEARSLQEQYKQGIFNARKDAVQQKLEKLEIVKKDNTAVLTEAETKASQISDNARKELEAKMAELSNSLNQKVENLSEEVVNKIKAKPRLAA